MATSASTGSKGTQYNQQSKQAGNGFTDFTKFGQEAFKQFENFKIPGFASDQLMESHRHNMESIAQLQKACMETVRSCSQLQTQYSRQAMEDCAVYMKSMTSAGATVDQRVKAQNQSMKDAMHKVVNQGQQLNKVLQDSQKCVNDLVQNRFDQSLEEAQSMAASATRTTKK